MDFFVVLIGVLFHRLCWLRLRYWFPKFGGNISLNSTVCYWLAICCTLIHTSTRDVIITNYSVACLIINAHLIIIVDSFVLLLLSSSSLWCCIYFAFLFDCDDLFISITISTVDIDSPFRLHTLLLILGHVIDLFRLIVAIAYWLPTFYGLRVQGQHSIPKPATISTNQVWFFSIPLWFDSLLFSLHFDSIFFRRGRRQGGMEGETDDGMKRELPLSEKREYLPKILVDFRQTVRNYVLTRAHR